MQGRPWASWHRYQHLYLGLLYGLLSIKAPLWTTFCSDFWKIGPVSINSFTNRSSACSGSKAFYFTYWFAALL